MQPVQGQKLLNRLKQKVEQKIEEQAAKKSNEETETESVIKDETSSEKNSDVDSGEEQMQQKMQGFLKGIGVSSTPVPIAESYHFNHLIQMHIESYDKSGGKTSEGEFITHFNPKSKSMAYQVLSGDMGKPGQGMFIIDAENSATIILSEDNGKKAGMVYGMDGFMQSMEDVYEDEELDFSETPESYLANPNITKTGRKKIVAGFKCDEYVYKDEDTKSEFWITKNLKINTQDYFSTLFKTSMYSNGMPWGYTMEVNSENLLTGEKSVMKVTNVETNSNTNFSMSDYEITNLGSFQMPEEK